MYTAESRVRIVPSRSGSTVVRLYKS